MGPWARRTGVSSGITSPRSCGELEAGGSKCGKSNPSRRPRGGGQVGNWLLVASSDRRLMVCIIMMAVMVYLLQLTEETGRSCKAR